MGDKPKRVCMACDRKLGFLSSSLTCAVCGRVLCQTCYQNSPTWRITDGSASADGHSRTVERFACSHVCLAKYLEGYIARLSEGIPIAIRDEPGAVLIGDVRDDFRSGLLAHRAGISSDERDMAQGGNGERVLILPHRDLAEQMLRAAGHPVEHLGPIPPPAIEF